MLNKSVKLFRMILHKIIPVRPQEELHRRQYGIVRFSNQRRQVIWRQL